MSERTESNVVKVGTVPDFLQNYNEQDTSLANVSGYRILPRISLIQGLTPQEKRGGHAPGDAILSPGGSLLMRMGQPVLFVPLFNFTEFISYWDRNDKSHESVIAERTYNPTSVCARKARSKDGRREPYGERDKNGVPRYYQNHVEHIQFAVLIYSGDLAGTIATLSFAKGEYFVGQAFCSLIMQRRVDGRNVPLWAQVYEMKSAVHKNKRGNEWFGIDCQNPQNAAPFIKNEEAPTFRAEFEKLNEQFQKGVLTSDEGLGQQADAGVTDDGSM